MHAPVFFNVCAVGFVATSLAHVALGISAEALLGATAHVSVLNKASLNSQIRFYGEALAIRGALLWLRSTDLWRHAQLVRIVLWSFFIAGLTRYLSMALHGLRSPTIIVLQALEVLSPPLLLAQL